MRQLICLAILVFVAAQPTLAEEPLTSETLTTEFPKRDYEISLISTHGEAELARQLRIFKRRHAQPPEIKECILQFLPSQESCSGTFDRESRRLTVRLPAKQFTAYYDLINQHHNLKVQASIKQMGQLVDFSLSHTKLYY